MQNKPLLVINQMFRRRFVRVYYHHKMKEDITMMNDDMIKKLIEVELANAGVEDDTVVDGKKLKAVLLEVFKLLRPEPRP